MSVSPTVSPRQHDSRAYVIGLASAALVMAFFGTMWSMWASTVIQQGTTRILYYAVVILIAIGLLAAGILLMLSARRLTQSTSAEDQARRSVEGRRYGIVFGIVFGLEFFFIGLASFLCINVFHNERAVAPVTAIIVGLHFLPLARLFEVRPYYITGIIMTLLGLATLLFIPTSTPLGADYAWIGIPALGSALTLYATGITAWFLGREAYRRAQA